VTSVHPLDLRMVLLILRHPDGLKTMKMGTTVSLVYNQILRTMQLQYDSILLKQQHHPSSKMVW